MPEQKQPTALFVADSHFHLRPDAAELARIDSFLDFLDWAAAADHLFLLGDIFDFWFDYPHFRLRGYEEILQGLDRVRAAGVALHFVGGNHDIWARDYFHERYGCPLGGPTADHRLGDRLVRVSHGDGLVAYDWAYNTFRRIVRTRAGIVLAKSLHPEILFAVSTWLSGHSRQSTRDEAARIEEKANTWLGRRQDEPWDLMVIGHLHHGFRIRHGRQLMACLPGWLENPGFGILQNGEFRLQSFPADLPDLGHAIGP